IHHLFRRQPERRARLDRGAQHVARGDLRNAVVLGEERCLRALAGARRAKKNELHRIILRTASRFCGVSTPGGAAAALIVAAMRNPCQSTRNCSSASASSSGDAGREEYFSRKETR